MRSARVRETSDSVSDGLQIFERRRGGSHLASSRRAVESESESESEQLPVATSRLAT